MEPNFTETERYYQAQKRVKEIRGFYEHLIVFILVTIILIVINLMTSPEYLWFLWCIMGWGVGLVFHGLKVFAISPFFNKWLWVRFILLDQLLELKTLILLVTLQNFG